MGTRVFIDGDADAAKGRCGKALFAPKLLDKALAVEGFFDAVLGVAFFADAADDVFAPVGKFKPPAKAVRNIEITRFFSTKLSRHARLCILCVRCLFPIKSLV